MSKEYLIKTAKGKLNKMLLKADLLLLDKSELRASPTSIERASFPDKEKMPLIMIFKMPKMISAMTSFFKSKKLIKKLEVKKESQSIDEKFMDEINTFLKKRAIDDIGYVCLTEADVFKCLAVPYRHVIIFTAKQDKDEILTSPSIRSQVEVGRIYGETGTASNELTEFLTDRGYGAMPSHSLGGVIDYVKLARKAGLGEIGRHGLLIEPTSGSNHRIGAVFTNIENLNEFFDSTNNHEWIKDFCEKCGKCKMKCPIEAIKDVPTINENGYTTCIDHKKCEVIFGNQFGCNICVAVCPFTTVGYDHLKSKSVKRDIQKLNLEN